MTGSITIDLAIEASRWRRADGIEAIARNAIDAAWQTVGDASRDAEVSLVLADDATVRRLNSTYRGQDKPTNVLSFPAGDMAVQPGAPVLLGDIVLAHETVCLEAASQEKPLGDHVAHLCVHGLLHLLGHDHDTDAEAGAMEALETGILAGLGIADPYRVDSVEQHL